jgi:dihydrodipicolinate synthase/N-acetylneuraminate lyase
MKTESLSPTAMHGVWAVPSLARASDLSIDFDANEEIVHHIREGGVHRLLYGGNSFLYHISLSDYEDLLSWLADLPDDLWCVPSAGPSYGRTVDQAPLLRQHDFPAVMMLPCGDPRDPAGLEEGYRRFAERAETPLVLYLKTEDGFGKDEDAGLDVVERLVDDGVCMGIKYAVVRDDPSEDAYLKELLKRVNRERVISGIGERPAIIHLRDWELNGFTTGSGCVAPRMCQALFEACRENDYDRAAELRETFMSLEDCRDAWGPSRVLHEAMGYTVTETGPILPYMSELSDEQRSKLKTAAQSLVRQDETFEAD